MAIIQSRDGKEIKLNDLKSSCKTYVASYKFPKELKFVKKIKRSPSGKRDYLWAKAQAIK